MEKQIAVTYPESLASSLKMNGKEFINEIKTISIVKLYELGKISSGMAAKLLDIDRLDFLELLAKYNVSYFQLNMEDELESDFRNA
jgi:predicted HTH domain antitoxin